VLVIDQHSAVRDALRAMLTSAGHEVVEVADAGVGLLAYQTVPADVVIIDVLGPGRMDAPEFLQRLRRLFPDARVVALAGRPSYTGVDRLAVTQGLGAARAIRMPLSRDQVLRVVEEVRP
jgi:two-component system response regulator EvgA